MENWDCVCGGGVYYHFILIQPVIMRVLFVCPLLFPCSAAGGRMVSSIRAVLLKGLSSADPVYTTVEDTVKELKERIQQIHTLQKESACGTGISPARVELIYFHACTFQLLECESLCTLQAKWTTHHVGFHRCQIISLMIIIVRSPFL